MKPWLRFFLGATFALLASGVAHAAASLSPTGVAATTAGKPGDSITFTISVQNSGAATPLDDFPAGGTAKVFLTLTNIASGYSFTLGTSPVATSTLSATAAAAVPGAGGSGSLVVTTVIPTKFTEAGSYSATVTIGGASSGTASGSFSVSSTVFQVTGKPNFVITGLTYASGTSYVGGNTVAMGVTYINQQSTNGVENVPWRSGTNGFSTYYRLKVVLSTNATFGDADDFQLTIQDFAAKVNADNTSIQSFNWTQLLPGNFAGSYYILAKIDALDQVDENDAPTLTVNGDNIWGSNAVTPTASLINLLPSNFPAMSLASHATGVTSSANAYSDNPSMSSDGRYVAYASDATNLVANDTNAKRDIFVFDAQTNTSRRVSLSQQGAEGDGASNNPAISGNGLYIAFASDARNLVLGDTNGFSDIFVVNRLTGLIARVSVTTAGGQANNPSFKPAISTTGRYVVFESTATNLDSSYTLTGTNVSHIYLRDRDVSNSGTFDTAGNVSTKIVDASVGTPATVAGDASAIQATISSDGTMIAFASKATNLAPSATTAARQHVYVRSTANVGTATSGTKIVSVMTGSTTEGDADSQTPSLTANGNWVAFASLATNLLGVGVDTNAVSDIFVYDTSSSVATPTVRRVSVTNAGAQGTDPTAATQRLGSINPTISSTGRYVAFASLDSNLTAGDSLGQFQANDSNVALDVFVRDRDSTASGTFDTVAATTQMVSVNTFGYQTSGLLGTPSTAANNIYPVMSSDGRFIALPSDAENNGGLAFGATNLLNLDNNTARDVFLFDRRITTLPNASVAPSVNITNPSNGSNSLRVNTPISITASATTTIGVVASVQFFVNGTSVGTSTVFPYSATWTPTAVGTYTLSALVTDSFGNLGVSTNVTVSINAAPSVGINFPTNNSTVTFGSPATITVTAAASISNPGASLDATSIALSVTGPIVAGSTAPTVSLTPVTTVTSNSTGATYSASWTPASTGNYTVTFTAAEITTQSVTVSQTTTASVSIVAAASSGGSGGGSGSGTPPTVSFNPAPPAGSAVNVPITLTSTASPATGFTVTSVQYSANGVSIGSSATFPYLVTWVPPALGTYSVRAVATDNAGTQSVSTTSNTASVVVSTGTSPTIALVSPNSGSSYSVGNPIALSATTNLGSGLIAGVEFFANNVSIGIKSIPATGQGASPFFNLEWVPAAAGTYTFNAIVTDTAGNRTTSTSVSVTVAAVAAPTVTLTSPTSGTAITVNQTQTITASALPGSGSSIASVAFFANGVSVGTDLAFPFSAAWTPTAPGTYTLRAVATDSFGTQTSSSTVSVTVGTGSSSLPFVYLTSVPTGTNVTANTPLYVGANAGDPDGLVTNVEFYANGNLIGSKAASPYFALWTPNVAGTYTITAVVTDDAGNRTTSTASTVTCLVPVGVVPITTLAFNDPSVDAPTGAATVTPKAPFTPIKVDFGSTLVISALAVDQDGSIASVQFFANGTSLATVSAAPYSTTYTVSTLSDVVLTAVITDSSGNAVHAAPILVNTQPSLTAAASVVTLVSPLSSATYVVGGQVLLSATHNFGSVTPPKIDFYVNGFQATTISAATGTGTSAPYQFVTGFARAGTYTIQAVGRLGNTTTVSAPVQITVTSNTAPTVSIRSPATGGSYVIGTPLTIATTVADSDGTIQNVQFFVNGVALLTANTSPYVAAWNPASPGLYTLTATATDDAGNQTLSSPVTVTFTGNTPPNVSLSTPTSGARVVAGSAVSIIASASDSDGTVANVRFLANGNLVGAPATAAPYTVTWTPTAAGIYSVVAQATDNSGNVSSSTIIPVNVLANQSPSVSLSTPTNGAVFRTGASAGLAATATDPDGTVASVQFLANGNVIGVATAAPFNVFWTPSSAGTYTIVAQASDNTGNVATSTAATVTVLPNQLPTISLTSPSNGGVVRAGSGATLSATASDLDGNVASVQFFANGVSLGAPVTALTSGSYRTQWTPASEGIYTISATAIDNSGAATTATATVLAVNSAAGAGDTVYTGTFFGLNETGKFAVINISGKTAAFIGYSTALNKSYFYSGIPVDAAKGFTLTDAAGRTLISGRADDTSATITRLDDAAVTMIGIVAFPSGSAVGSGYYTGSLAGRPASQLAAIVGPDASIMLFASDGNVRTSGAGTVTSAGVFTNIPALGGGTFTGKADPATNFLSGNLTGPLAGGMMGAVESGVSFSDGTLRNLSSRGQVGTGTNVLVAGFNVGGTVPKQVLIRAIGPSLTQFGITGAIANPALSLFGGTGGQALVASNDNWGGTAQLFNASGPVGAFTLSPTSLDSVILTTLAPGNYTAQVSGVNGVTGTALVELYDVDNPTAYSSQKVTNISTRALVGTGQNRLIAGFVVSGNTAKKVLIRAVGPTLGAAPFNIAGVLADPVLRIIRNSDNLLIRENDNWEVGNDISLVNEAAVKTGAFALASGGKDAVVLISLPPGSYSAEVTGAGTSTGIALVEVYEVP